MKLLRAAFAAEKERRKQQSSSLAFRRAKGGGLAAPARAARGAAEYMARRPAGPRCLRAPRVKRSKVRSFFRSNPRNSRARSLGLLGLERVGTLFHGGTAPGQVVIARRVRALAGLRGLRLRDREARSQCHRRRR